jgi:hypothetical protein
MSPSTGRGFTEAHSDTIFDLFYSGVVNLSAPGAVGGSRGLKKDSRGRGFKDSAARHCRAIEKVPSGEPRERPGSKIP